jgi:hypothetical protein
LPAAKTVIRRALLANGLGLALVIAERLSPRN